jgi:hypothetical protein
MLVAFTYLAPSAEENASAAAAENELRHIAMTDIIVVLTHTPHSINLSIYQYLSHAHTHALSLSHSVTHTHTFLLLSLFFSPFLTVTSLAPLGSLASPGQRLHRCVVLLRGAALCCCLYAAGLRLYA